MKKFKVLSLIIAMLMLSGTIASADDNTLDIEKAAIKTMQNSSSLKQANNSLDMISKLYHEMNNSTSKMKQLLYIPDFYSYNLTGMSKYDLSKNLALLPYKARTMLDQTTNKVQAGQNTARIASYSAYITVLEAKCAVDAQQKLVNNLEFNYNKSLVKLKSGSISQAEAKLAEISYNREKLVLQTYQRNLESATMALNKAMGEPLTKQYAELKDDNINPSDTIKPLKDYVDSALASRVEIINAQLDVNYMTESQSYEKVYHPLDTDVYYDTSKYDLDSAQNAVDNAKINVQIDLSYGYRNLESKMKDMEYWQKQYDLAKQAYDNTSKSYDQGMVSEYQLMESDRTLTGAKIQLRVAQLEAWLYQVRMDVASGLGSGIKDQDITLQALRGGVK